MGMFVELVAWQNYASELLVTCEVGEHEAERRLKLVQTQKMVMDWDNPKDTATKVKAQIAQDPAVVEAEREVMTAYAERKYTKMIYENTERMASLVSRELSRRIGRDGVERRQSRWTA